MRGSSCVFAVATAGGTLSRLIGIAGLMFSEGPSETIRMLRNVSAGRRQIKSVALETYWSRGALRWGPKLAVRFLLRPASPAPLTGPDLGKDPEGLSKEAAARLAAGAIQFELCVQRFVNAEVTPIEDTSVPWTPEAAPVEKVATLTIPQADVNTPEARARFASSTRLRSILGTRRMNSARSAISTGRARPPMTRAPRIGCKCAGVTNRRCAIAYSPACLAHSSN